MKIAILADVFFIYSDKWRSYGTVTSYTIPGLMGWCVNLGGYRAIYEALVTQAEKFSDRPPNLAQATFSKPGSLLVCARLLLAISNGVVLYVGLNIDRLDIRWT